MQSEKAYKRIDWDEYFMRMAFLAAQRSPDSQTQHGCVIVDQSNRVVSTGYNGFPAGMRDAELPTVRPAKYAFIIHSEVNAVISAKQSLTKCKAYITGPPCNECLKVLIQAGIREIIVGDRDHIKPDNYEAVQSVLLEHTNTTIRKFTFT